MKTESVPIEACAKVLPGFSIKTAVVHDPNGTHQIILAKYLSDDNLYRYNPEHELRILPKKSVDRYLVTSGDLIFMSRGALNRTVLLETVPHLTLASASFYILKPKQGISPAYLAWYLNQDPFQIKITEIRTGAGTPFVPRSGFSKIPITLPPMDVQQKLGEINRLMNRERYLMNKRTKLIKQKHRLLGTKIINSFERKT